MSTGEKVGTDVTKSVYLESDGHHAFYASGQTYTGVEGERMLEQMTSEKLHWVTHDDGRTTLDACYDGTWLRSSEDNGTTWTDVLPKVRFDTSIAEEQKLPSGFLLDERTGILIRLYRGQIADKTCYGYINQGAYREFYSISSDAGQSWTDPVQVIDHREPYDDIRWAPDLEYGVRGAIFAGGKQCVWLENGSLLAPFTVYERLERGPWNFRVVCATGTWSSDRTALDWEFGSWFEVSPNLSAAGCCEPSIISLGGDRLFMTTRCQGNESQGIYSTRFTTTSEDGGKTWSSPTPLLYDDGTPVHTPASISAFYDSSVTGKSYWVGNILDAPVYAQTPRYPLNFAEFDKERTCLIKDSLRVIQDRPEGAHEHVRYTNFGIYEDRVSGHLIITLPEQYRSRGYDQMERPEDFAASCVKYTVEL